MRNAPGGWQLLFPQPPTGSPSTRARQAWVGISLGTMAARLLHEIRASECTSASDSPSNVSSRILRVSRTRICQCGYSDSNKFGVPVVGEVSGLVGSL